MNWLMDYQQPFLLVAAADQIEDLTRKLMRIGLDQILGYVTEVSSLSMPLETAQPINLDAFKAYLQRKDVQVLDLRGAAEYESGHVPGADHLFVGHLAEELHQISRDQPVIIYCQAGDRATIGYSLLRAKGFINVHTYSGGMKEWVEQSQTIACA